MNGVQGVVGSNFAVHTHQKNKELLWMDFSESALFLRNESLRCVPNIARFSLASRCAVWCAVFL